MLAGLVLVMTLADLLLDFLGNFINSSVEVAIVILRVKIRTANSEPDGALELALRRLGVVVFQRNAGIHCPTVKVLQFINPDHDMVFDRLGQRHIVRRKNKFHARRMGLGWNKIQRNRFTIRAEFFSGFGGSDLASKARRTAKLDLLPGGSDVALF